MKKTMIRTRNKISFLLTLSIGCLLAVSCNQKQENTKLIITQVPHVINKADFITGENWRFISEAQIVAIDTDKPSSIKTLTSDFYSAAYPEISYDGKNILFAAQKEKGDLWQVWEMNIKTRKYRKVISTKYNCADPAYAPVGRMVFTMNTVNDTVKNAFCLFTCKLDGTNLTQITFAPYADFATTVLKDGRFLTINRRLLPETGKTMFFVMRPDGTKADMFYTATEGNIIVNRGREILQDDRILFVEAEDNNPNGGDLISIDYKRPLYTRLNHTAGIDGAFYTVLPMKSGNIIVSYRKSDEDNLALYEFDAEENKLGRKMYENPEYNVLDAVEAVKYERPKKLPSEVDLKVKTGQVLCQDINMLGFESTLSNNTMQKAMRVEVLGVDSSYGIVSAESDGSIYLKILADIPFRLRTLDEDGNVVNGPCTWLWIRPNERRGCVGCHEDPELVPHNRIPLAVKEAPEIIPTSIDKIVEKKVELE